MRKLSWIIAGILCTSAPMTALHAAQLGSAQVESKLTQQLKVKIPIEDAKGTALDDIDVRLAPRSYYEQAGLTLDKVQGNLIFKIKKDKSGTYVIVTSRRPVMDPIYSFLLQVSSGDSSNIREYDLLLDPPLHTPTAQKKVVVASAPAPKASRTSSNTAEEPAKPRSSWVPPKSVPQVQMGATYTVKRGDTLYEIASKATHEKKIPVRGMMQAIINENPKAFPNGDGNLMLAGAKLKVPKSVVANHTEMATTQASTENATKPKLTLMSAEGSASSNSTESGTSQNSASSDNASAPATTTPNESTAPDKQDQAATTESGNASSAPSGALPSEKLPAVEGATKPAATEEDIASIQAHNEAMSKQIGMLNDQLKQVQDQMTARNERIEKLQQQVQSAEHQTTQLQDKLHAQTENLWSKWGLYLTGGLGVIVIFLLLLALSNRKRDEIEPEQASASPGPKIDQDNASPIVGDELEAAGAAAASVAPEVLAEMPDPVLASGLHDDASAAIQEAQLLVSYNLHGQAIDLLKDTMDHHPDDVQVYRALAEIYANEGRSEELNDILDRIESRFGSDQRPDLHVDAKTSETTEEGGHEEPEATPETFENESAEEIETFEPIEEAETEAQKPADPLLDTIDFDSGETIQSTGFEDIDLTEEEPQHAPEEALEDLELDLGGDLDASAEEQAEPTQQEEITEEAPQASEESKEPQLSSGSDDTRLGLAEAFLNVGDMESFKMIADEINAEGNQDLIDKLEQIRQSHQGE